MVSGLLFPFLPAAIFHGIACEAEGMITHFSVLGIKKTSP